MCCDIFYKTRERLFWFCMEAVHVRRKSISKPLNLTIYTQKQKNYFWFTVESLKLICPWKVALFRAYIFQSTSSMKEILCLENLKESQLPYSTIPGKSTAPELRCGNVLHTQACRHSHTFFTHSYLQCICYSLFWCLSFSISGISYFWENFFSNKIFHEC